LKCLFRGPTEWHWQWSWWCGVGIGAAAASVSCDHARLASWLPRRLRLPHWSISMGDPLSKVASNLESSKQSCLRNFVHPFQQRSCNWTLTWITSAALLGWRALLCLMSLVFLVAVPACHFCIPALGFGVSLFLLVALVLFII
jgi:hypothetical protein